MTKPKPPARLRARGRAFWDEITEGYTLDAPQMLQLEEVCRTADRLEALDRLLTGDASDWIEVTEKKGSGGEQVEVVIDKALSEARQQANILKQLIAALRLPDEATGKRPQARPARGAHQPKGTSSSKNRLRAV